LATRSFVHIHTCGKAGVGNWLRMNSPPYVFIVASRERRAVKPIGYFRDVKPTEIVKGCTMPALSGQNCDDATEPSGQASYNP